MAMALFFVLWGVAAALFVIVFVRLWHIRTYMDEHHSEAFEPYRSSFFDSGDGLYAALAFAKSRKWKQLDDPGLAAQCETTVRLFYAAVLACAAGILLGSLVPR